MDMLLRLGLGIVGAGLIAAALFASLWYFGIYGVVGLLVVIFLMAFAGVLLRAPDYDRGEQSARASSQALFMRKRRIKAGSESTEPDVEGR